MKRLAAESWLYCSLLIAVVLLLAPYAGAAPRNSDRDQPINLSAERAEIDNVKGVSVYQGNVVLTQGTLKITGNVMHVYYTPGSRELNRIVVQGDPATYQELLEGESEYVHAKAPRMEYYAAGPRRVRLLQGATLWQGRNTFHGNQVVYNIEADQVEASSGKSSTQRIQITIYPNQKQGKQTGGSR